MERVVGYDYGIKPKVMIVGDVEFPSLLGDRFLALAYAVEPQFGVLVNAPMLVLVFESENAGMECFARFQRWCEASASGDAVALGFVELASDEYVMCIYPEPERLVQRMVPETHRPEMHPLTFELGYSKTFPRGSGGYDWFKRAAKRSPFVVAPGTPTGSVMTDAAFYKTEVNFYHQDNLPDHSMEAGLLHLRQGAGEDAYRPESHDARLDSREIAARRLSQLSRFYPVTLERLGFDQGFRHTMAELMHEGYKEWQVVQASCNLALRSYAPELFSPTYEGDEESTEESVQGDILDYLLGNTEDALKTFPPTDEMSAPALRRQIAADSGNLLSYVADPGSHGTLHEDLQAELARRGLLEA